MGHRSDERWEETVCRAEKSVAIQQLLDRMRNMAIGWLRATPQVLGSYEQVGPLWRDL